MKSIFQPIATAIALVGAAAIVAPRAATAADVRLDGYGFYSLKNRVKYYGRGKPQSGRYKNLGADYYHQAKIGMDFLTNHSNSRSGNLSFELWAMPYYGATSGIILMTRKLSPLGSGKSRTNLRASGNAIPLRRGV